MTALTPEQIDALGLRRTDGELRIDASARFYGAESVTVGARTRIDAFTVITAGPAAVAIGEHVHVAASAMLFGTAGIVLEDFANISSRVVVYSTSDDFTGGALTGPTVDDDLRGVDAAPVHVGRHVVIGTGSVVLPGVRLGFGAAVGALSLVKESVGDGEIVAGVPSRVVGMRPVDELAAREREVRDREAAR